MTRPLLLTPGDPEGIGPEVAVKALAQRPQPDVVLVGAFAPLAAWAERVAVPIRRVEGPVVGDGLRVWEPREGAERVEIRSLRLAVATLLAGQGRALVTGPIHKARLAASGFRHPGHTEFLAELAGVPTPVMAFVGGRVAVVLATVHLPLAAVPSALTVDGLHDVLRRTDAAWRRLTGRAPTLRVCGLNPHAGDGGVLGDEERRIVGPAVARARADGIVVDGPMSAEAAWVAARRERGAVIVAMYHDQGLVPLKALDFGRCAQISLGLPFVRTSVDHGTADDLAGRGLADPGSMGVALRWARRLSRVRAGSRRSSR